MLLSGLAVSWARLLVRNEKTSLVGRKGFLWSQTPSITHEVSLNNLEEASRELITGLLRQRRQSSDRPFDGLSPPARSYEVLKLPSPQSCPVCAFKKQGVTENRHLIQI